MILRLEPASEIIKHIDFLCSNVYIFSRVGGNPLTSNNKPEFMVCYDFFLIPYHHPKIRPTIHDKH